MNSCVRTCAIWSAATAVACLSLEPDFDFRVEHRGIKLGGKRPDRIDQDVKRAGTRLRVSDFYFFVFGWLCRRTTSGTRTSGAQRLLRPCIWRP